MLNIVRLFILWIWSPYVMWKTPVPRVESGWSALGDQALAISTICEAEGSLV